MTREDELILEIKKGNVDALDELIGLYYPEILRYCIWHAPNRGMAEDAVQETFLKAVRYFGRYVHKGNFRAFLYQIAKNTCIDLQRQKSSLDISLDAAALEFSYEPSYEEKGFEEVRADMQMRYFVRKLPDELKEIVILRFGQELTIREIAEIMNTPLRTVQSRLRSALKQIKKELGKEGRNDEKKP